MMIETEELGVSVLQDLHSQRQSLLRTGDTVCMSPSLHHEEDYVLSIYYV